MHFFSEYIQPLTIWLYAHPHWALLITFLISFAESLAIIGSIIPGSVTMTAIGILAGSGVMRIDLTLLAATLGAIAGDSASYLLGYTFSDRLVNFWPFSRYPNWLRLGKEYFSRHGGKSVLIGRFVGPLRSIIPVIAGMMGMSQWRFFIANTLSAIGWAILYVFPGILIGAASSELSHESATRLFLLVLLLLAGIWLLSVGLKWLFIRLNHLLRVSLHGLWSWSRNHPHLARLFKLLTPADELDYYPTASLVVLFSLGTLFFCILTGLVIHEVLIVDINQSIYLFLQSLRTHAFDAFFIIVSQIINPFTLSILVLVVSVIAIYFRDWRSLIYWLSLGISCTIILLILHGLIANLRPQGLLEVKDSYSYPLIELTFATAFFSAFMFFINTYGRTLINRFVKITLSVGLFLSGFAALYLGDNWITDILGAYLCGFSLCLLHWLFYRRYKSNIACTTYGPLKILLLLVVVAGVSAGYNYRQMIRDHQPYLAQYVFTDELWWEQSKPILPVYRTNRIGNYVSVFNIQYVGSLANLEHALTNFGWKKVNDSLFNSLLTRISGQASAQDLPLMAQLYLNRRPVLMMIYQPKDGNPVQILRVWRSNYHLQHFRQPIWLGSVHPRKLLKPHELNKSIPKQGNRPASLFYISSALPEFLQRQTPLPIQLKLPVQVEPNLLLIKESPNDLNR
ncbi:VTT domain-containing protein [Legionella hackeliae]|uniref:Legionella secretion system protein Y n=1 Tax=Legionella hackeliae TaxID=449 RepID=A0A0A8UPM5_LEGHA|nr:VTT domain-containing protein [Legionella hackeliae]KTD11489.1 secretion system protein Y [Legionella hackeliae]CEK10678.1 Legionella secretion system protein Y [Legionella hackeliae]STX47425.1 DedA/PAP2 domain protein [Legionella hackeliae]